MFGLDPETERDLTVKSIRDFLDGTGGDRDWDIYTSISLKNTVLNDIRKKALSIDLPLAAEDRPILEALLKEAQDLPLRLR
ncbi:hypothetical protein FHS95_002633 [Sphingomonas naasensis]|uniref:Uncharacterized protein n=1 Tax=Sphingomonas naasensis TaxID=1344951 RepID=A0A4S1WJG0_9SPHN|nr:hypothetical protein [Sphingomonas naasensis]NIJ20941.1 hypothetical protein [Sphingomonas naasensis]TGX43328.1 hypothetical protein E5A74_09190 [Sphingomonas naasensis]